MNTETACAINSKACLCPRAEDVRQRAGLQQNMWLISVHGLSSNGSGLRTKSTSIWSINNKKNIVFALLVSSQKSLSRNCTPFAGSHFPPSTQPFTSGSYRAIEHSAGTSTSPTSATKSILKQHSPQFPHYFTCQMLTKQLWKAKCSSGAPQHTSCQPQP